MWYGMDEPWQLTIVSALSRPHCCSVVCAWKRGRHVKFDCKAPRVAVQFALRMRFREADVCVCVTSQVRFVPMVFAFGFLTLLYCSIANRQKYRPTAANQRNALIGSSACWFVGSLVHRVVACLLE